MEFDLNIQPFRRFFLNRIKDGNFDSGPIDVILTAVLTPTNRVIIESYENPPVTVIFESLESFIEKHVNQFNKIIWIDRATEFYCAGCGSGGMQGNFCSMCGSPSMSYCDSSGKFDGRYQLERELDELNLKMIDALTLDEKHLRNKIRDLLCSGEI